MEPKELRYFTAPESDRAGRSGFSSLIADLNYCHGVIIGATRLALPFWPWGKLVLHPIVVRGASAENCGASFPFFEPSHSIVDRR
jgi:hypothetical protein